jgi:hypothetical protein
MDSILSELDSFLDYSKSEISNLNNFISKIK